jgi:membrane protein DedA with SNARE-associated domain
MAHAGFTSFAGTAIAFVAATISVLGYPGILILMALESMCLPVPSEIVMPFSGYLAAMGRFNLMAVATIAATGCTLGSTISYFIGATGGRALVERWGRSLHVSNAELDRFENYFRRYGAITVFIARILPMVPPVISFPAGIAKMPLWKFQAFTFSGTWLWCFGLAYAGSRFGRYWESNPGVQALATTLDAVAVFILLAGVAMFAWNRRRRAADDSCGGKKK